MRYSVEQLNRIHAAIEKAEAEIGDAMRTSGLIVVADSTVAQGGHGDLEVTLRLRLEVDIRKDGK